MALRQVQNRRAPLRPARWIAPLVAVLVTWITTPAWSADVLAVRVGQHPEYTRIVFELDAPAGYRVGQSTASDGSSTIVVTLDATAKAQTIRSGSSLVRSVGIETSAGKATARIALRKSGLPLKEMILSNPPRIVLDVLGSDTALTRRNATQVAAKPRSAPATKPEVRETTPIQVAAEAPKPAAKRVAPTPQASRPATPAKESEPTIARPVIPPAPAKTPEAPKPEIAAADEPAPIPMAGAEQAAREAMETRLKAVREASDARRREAEKARAEREAREIAQTSKRAATDATRAMPEPSKQEDASIDPMLAAGLAGGVVLLVVLFMLMRRRRSLPKDLDVTMLVGNDDPAASADGRGASELFTMGGDVGSAADADLPVASSSASARAGLGTDSVTGIANRERAPLSAPGLFDELEKNDEPATGGSVMDQETRDTGMDTMQSTPVHSSTGAGSSDVATMMREMERRMTHLESRLDEAVAARERLERQVAAQSEELRVQRAAIARTQRALRGLSRTDEEQATEPALRDPS